MYQRLTVFLIIFHLGNRMEESVVSKEMLAYIICMMNLIPSFLTEICVGKGDRIDVRYLFNKEDEDNRL